MAGTSLLNKDCTLCGRCLQACPLVKATAKEELSPRAKSFLVQAMEQDIAVLTTRRAEDLAALCLGCGRCGEVCPQGLAAPDLVAKLRAAHPGFEGWLWKTWIKGGSALWPAMARVSGLVPNSSTPGSRRGMIKALDGRTSLTPWLRITSMEPSEGYAGDKQAALFPGCFAGRTRPGWLAKARDILDQLGIAAPEGAKEPRWDCCGSTLGHAGLRKEEIKAHQHNVDIWRDLGRPLLVVVCASCGHGLKETALDRDIDWAEGEAEMWRESVVWLSSLIGSIHAELLDNAPEQVRYHSPCHARPQDPDKAFLARLLGERFSPGSDEACCGLGGVLQLAAPELSRSVAAQLWTAMAPTPGAQVLTGCSGCVLQLTATAPKNTAVGHWLEILA
ncbi:MAG: (Fe-S)-binding protein [Desulfovibrio sp.]|nr:MAG: (Fe-S)-binding protein [Desulfovibrio sp.]